MFFNINISYSKVGAVVAFLSLFWILIEVFIFRVRAENILVFFFIMALFYLVVAK